MIGTQIGRSFLQSETEYFVVLASMLWCGALKYPGGCHQVDAMAMREMAPASPCVD
jgi:hypothetical protein